MFHDPRERPVGELPELRRSAGWKSIANNAEDREMVDAALTAIEEIPQQSGDAEECAQSIATFLSHPSSEVQVGACSALMNLGEAGLFCASAVCALLGSSVPAVRLAATEALGSIGPRGPGVVSGLGLSAVLDDPEVPNRCAALKAIGSLGDTSSLDVLVKHLSDASPEVAAAACSSLAIMHAPLSQGQVDSIAEKLSEGRTRTPALEALSKVDKDMVAKHSDIVVSQCLGDQDILTREQAIVALGHLAASTTLQATVMENIVDQLNSQEAYKRCAAALALGHMGEKALPHCQAVADLLADDAEDRTCLAWQLSGAFMRQPSYMKKPKCAAIAALGMLGSAWAVGAEDSEEWQFEGKLEAALKDEDCEARACALRALLQLGNKCKADVDAVATLLEDDACSVRVPACAVLAALHAADKADQLADALADPAPSVRTAALLALAALGEDAAEHAPRVLARLDDHVDTVRSAAATALGQLGEDGRCFAGVLARVLSEEPSPEVRCALLEALGQMGQHGQALQDEVAEFAHDEDPGVCEAAALALERLSSAIE